MTARALVSGVVFRALERKTAKTGKPYAQATLREQHGADSRFWRVTIFSETTMAEIERLAVGEPIALAGVFEAEIYAPPDGKPARVSFTLIADAALSARAPAKSKATGRAAEESARPGQHRGTRPISRDGVDAANARWAARNGGSTVEAPNDDLPF